MSRASDLIRKRRVSVNLPTSPVESKQPEKINWALVILVGVMTWLVMSHVNINPTPGPTPTPVDPGNHVLIMYDDDVKPSPGQAGVVNSLRVRKHAEDLGYDYRKFEKSEDLTNVEKHWKQMKDLTVTPYPAITIAKEGRAVSKPLPDTISKTLELIK
jgi:hypothetical protein